jgi:hypothetical protein
MNSAVARRIFALMAILALAPVGVRAQTPYVIKSVSSGLVLDVPNFSQKSDTEIEQYPENDGKNQQWLLKSQPNGYEIMSSSSKLVFDVNGFSLTPGTHIWQHTANSGSNQLWTLGARAYNTYEIVSLSSGQVLDVPNFSTDPGMYIEQWPDNRGTNQEWIFTKICFLCRHYITVEGAGRSTGGLITVTGYNFQPGSTVYIRYMGIPNRRIPYAGGFANVGSDGKFTVHDNVVATSHNLNDAFHNVTVVAEVQGYAVELGQVSASYWVIPPGQ